MLLPALAYAPGEMSLPAAVAATLASVFLNAQGSVKSHHAPPRAAPELQTATALMSGIRTSAPRIYSRIIPIVETAAVQ